MIKIRIDVLTGLHAGANWEFNTGTVTIGGSSDCGVFLCDAGLPDYCLILKIVANKVLLDLVDSRLQGDEEIVGREGRWVYPGQSFELESNGVRFQVSIVDFSGVFAARALNAVRRVSTHTAEYVQRMGVQLVVGVCLSLAFLSTITILFFGSSGNELNAQNNGIEYIDPNSLEFGKDIVRPNLITDTVRSELIGFASNFQVSFSSLVAGANNVTVSAAMSRFQIRQFESLLLDLARDYGTSVNIGAEVRLTPEQEIVDRIQVRSVSFGQQPVVTLMSGERLFIGSYYNDLRLADVSENSIVLVGDSTYRIPL